MGILDGRKKMSMVPMRRFLRARVVAPLALVGFLILLFPGASLYYSYSGGSSCASCHEIWQPYREWQGSAHRNIPCTECHGSVFTLDAGFHLRNISQLIVHLRGRAPDRVRLKSDDVFKVAARCGRCHRQEQASWASGPHATTYAEIFLDKKQNHQQRLMDDCLRCHGMHFEGSIRDLVTPLDTQGPWRLVRPELSGRPAIPCIVCHQMHREGTPLLRGETEKDDDADEVNLQEEDEADDRGPKQELFRPSLALFDRRQLDYVPVGRLPLPQIYAGERVVRISPDQRQALCYQCHAPRAGGQAGSGDDRTPIGVHEGLSCLACHDQHGQATRASCANCHPQLSNCGIDVETMDTTFKSRKSKHNVHSVTCLECHTKGVPKGKKVQPERVAAR